MAKRPNRKTRGILDNVSTQNIGKLVTSLVHPEKRLTEAEVALADHLMQETLHVQ